MISTAQIKTIALAAGIALLCSACANEPLASAPMQLGASAQARAASPATRNRTDTHTKYKKTLSDKMLAASALERVTGRKPHPTRFGHID